ncbi:hypothetical protein LEMLEM_LOCUS26711, partial [Lemmus lemmus]
MPRILYSRARGNKFTSSSSAWPTWEEPIPKKTKGNSRTSSNDTLSEIGMQPSW